MNRLFALLLLTALIPASAGEARSASAKAGWQVSTEKSPVDDSESVQLSLISSNTFQDRFGRVKVGALIISCIENKTNIRLWAGGEFLAANGDFGYVTFRIDKRPADKKYLMESTDNMSLGLWNGMGIDLIKDIASGSTLFVRMTPYNEASIDLRFKTAGLSKVLSKVKTACAWE